MGGEGAMNDVPVLDRRLSELSDRELLGLLAELDHVTRLDYRQFSSLTLMQYLFQSIYPQGGAMKSRPLDSRMAVPGLLLTRLDKITSEPIQSLCMDLAHRAREVLEAHATSKLLTFLNKILRKLDMPRKKRRR